ncbi:MAG: transglycosylase SLT domain-containing protein [Nitrosomonas sp.]|nr:transglycosylase SLT domain-containing protein [Nitrosomonas sp.]
MIDLPPDMQERVMCSITAAVKYEIPANILLAIAEKEGGKPGQWVRNSNGTHDVGAMQFNTTYLKDLSKYGITTDHVAEAGCYAYDLAAWRVRQHIKNDPGDVWTKAANYHSRTPKVNSRYRADLIVKAVKWADWLDNYLNTVNDPEK